MILDPRTTPNKGTFSRTPNDWDARAAGRAGAGAGTREAALQADQDAIRQAALAAGHGRYRWRGLESPRSGRPYEPDGNGVDPGRDDALTSVTDVGSLADVLKV